MKEITDFKPGTKFKYLGNRFKNEYDRIQEVIHILTIGGEPSVRSKFLDNGFTHIFYFKNNKTSYSFHCYPLDVELSNGIPMFWDELDEFK
jgi:hypothetical protein